MGNPIQSIRITYDYAKKARDNGNTLNNEDIVKMLNVLGVPNEYIEKFPRFQKGYAAEDLFMRIYSLLPWIKNIVPLGQEQYPEKSKETSQVPDYNVTYETGADSTLSLLIEVKLVDENKSTHAIKSFQYNVLNKYSTDNNLPLLFALFWKKKGVWTLNSIHSFRQLSSEYKISYDQAVKNDLSSIFGDYIYVFMKPFYRKSSFNIDASVNSEYYSSHEELGRTILEEISYDGTTYQKLDPLFSPVIDSIFDMKEISKKHLTPDTIELIESYSPTQTSLVAIKLSTLIYFYLVKLWRINKHDLYYANDTFIQQTFDIVDTARRFLLGERYYLIPYTKNPTHEQLMISQFGLLNHITDTYNSFKRDGDYTICSGHDENSPNIFLQTKSEN